MSGKRGVGFGADPGYFTHPTDCLGWDVQAVLGHLLGMFEMQADPQERDRQLGLAAQQLAASGGLRIDALTALQVREHAHLQPGRRGPSATCSTSSTPATRGCTGSTSAGGSVDLRW